VRPQPNPEPAEKELPPAPDEISWNDTKGLELTQEEMAETKLWGRFEDMSDLEGTRPVMLYVYWPEEDEENSDEEIANQVRRCKLMDEILDAEAVRRASVEFHCFKCSIKDMSDQLKGEYKITLVPKVLFFDVKGRKVWQLTSTSAKADGVARKMVQIASDCRTMTKNASK
jgi:hypothetical protein